VGGKCIGGRSSVVIGWGKNRGGGKDRKRVGNSSWEGEQWIVAQEKKEE
jgi:hypothetical protein